MKTLKTTWTGIRPLILHNGRLADPLDPHSRALKEISGKRKKTDADHEQMARIEFEGGLYFDDEAGPFMPSDCLEACIQAGAKKSRIGKDVAAVVFVQDDVVKIDYEGPRTVEGMWKDRERFVMRKACKVAQAKIMRTRPMIPTGWQLTFTLEFDESIVNEANLRRAMVDAGALCGLCDWRPRFGRFTVE